MISRRFFVSRARLLTLAAMAALALMAGSHSRFAWSQGEGTELVILPSSAIQGELAPCG